VFDRNGLSAWIAVKKVLTAPFRGLAVKSRDVVYVVVV
jgi:hypothetical protein